MTPKIFVLAHPNFSEAFKEFLKDENLDWIQTKGTAAERLIEFAGRICYMSFGPRQSDRINREYILNLIKSGHESVLEHVTWTFLLSGVTRAFTHQLVRHRIGFSFSQLSQQYHDESEATFLAPHALEKSPEALAIWQEAIEQSHNAYRKILKLLSSPEANADYQRKEFVRATRSAARSVLPNATETKIVVTANGRALRHFLALRGCTEGDHEMRAVSTLVYNLIAKDAPALVADFKLELASDGLPIVLHTGEKS
jgi:thymidylate synthase (FAD)